MAEPLKYVPSGQCIYCGTVTPYLTDEHVVPKGLGGDLVLKRASCVPCAKITGGMEQKILRPLLGVARLATGSPTRRKKGRLTHLPITLIKPDGSDGEKLLVPVDEHPAWLMLPMEDIAGMLVGRNQDSPVADRKFHLGAFGPYPAERVAKLQQRYGPHWLHHVTVDQMTFARFLAKIAHGMAVANFGLGAFSPLTVPLILGQRDWYDALVGMNRLHPPKSDTLYEATVRPAGPLILVEIRLFAFMDTPTFHVVTGFLL